MDFFLRLPSPVGTLTLASDGESLTGLWIQGQRYFAAGLSPHAREAPELPALRAGERWLEAYFAGRRPEPSALPLSPRGSDFQRLVWELLTRIPYGSVTSYGALARQAAARLGRERESARAVGGAVGRNPLSILIPCHRVLGADGSLTGYAGGLDAKLFLLRLEGAAPRRP